ncbi:unnamed protein product [Caenorhabditis nigoni]|uniref:Lin-15A/B-like domain-containing protein n=1 Tax=Caenorhabditis nigoni TaxID=1611254 RepID=A0A2G5TQI7_9PELO|nr:hypothetical protein B9Z55_021086 [Caenorhabditis nigoni]
MNEAVVKEEVIEEEHNFTFRNGEYIEVKQEEVELELEYLLEKEIKMETNDDFSGDNISDGFFEDVKLEPKESHSKIDRICKICHKRMPRSLSKLITSEEDKTVLSEMFNVEFMGTNPSYVCYSHIQTIIDENDGKLKLARTPFEKLLRSFIRKNKKLIKVRTPHRHYCHVCHIAKNRSELYEASSKGIRMVVMIGRILRGTHSVEQAKSYLTDEKRFACYSHFKESIDKIFEHLGVRNFQEFFKCPTVVTRGLMDIVKNIDSSVTANQIIYAFHELLLKRKRGSK